NRKKDNSTPEAHRKRANSYVNFEGMPMQISPLLGTHPLAVFINPKSGGRQGARLLHKFQYLLNPRQVFNLGEGGPGPGLKFFQSVSDFRVLCCGGDGTAGWVLATIDKLQIKMPPPVAILPLGTGNDLARCLKWGGGYEGGSLSKVLSLIQKSSVVSLDRWSISFTQTNPDDDGDPPPLDIINNYFSIGVVSVCQGRKRKRLRHDSVNNSRLTSRVLIQCDGEPLELPQLEGIAVVNIPSVYGGANLWGETDKKKARKWRAKSGGRGNELDWAVQDIGDGQLEVVGLENSLYVGQIIAGVRAHGLRLAQGASITIRTKRLFPMQIDGEPWMQPPAEIFITHKNQVPMLQGPPPVKSSFFFFKRPVRDPELESEI
ncbi:PREDICTED: diacylglycerol kinase gamma-like, partial [Acropora digitifera]|uniref:diacylglycerol kinase gamma-like n=1 Tax=Acropora digitifera TaxID=70779 RepID=UPI00077A89AF